MSASILSARSVAILSAAGSSGFGDFTVGKSPFGILCSSTICTSVKPALFKASGIRVIEVPCIEVKTILIFSRPFVVITVAFFTAASINLESIFSPINSIKFSLASKLISLKSRALISSIISPSCGGII